MPIRPLALLATILSALLLVAVAACGDDDGEETTPTAAPTGTTTESTTAAATDGPSDSITVYSGRSETLVQPVIDQFEEATGIEVNVRYGDTAEMAATILEEGGNSPADVFFAQDGGALGALASEGLLTPLPDDILNLVDTPYRSHDGFWVGISGRARVVAYNTEELTEADLPGSILDFTDPQWDGRIGWAPTNGSLQAFVTALRILDGDDAARAWLEGIQANNPSVYEGNTQVVEGVANGEVDVGFVNHYYLYRFLEEQGESFPARNYYTEAGDPGSLINIAGASILESSGNKAAAEEFIRYMLSTEGQQYFADETFEYPLIDGVETHPDLVPLAQIQPPDIDLSDLEDLEGTLDLMREAGVLP
ncbi:MAG TPA: iron ABC transporter substrate-binding protein [Dehalococcoidia bacterium]|nr:iron ABC transporter substrate-binding protein [Dehalococcoidia bacterium]